MNFRKLCKYFGRGQTFFFSLVSCRLAIYFFPTSNLTTRRTRDQPKEFTIEERGEVWCFRRLFFYLWSLVIFSALRTNIWAGDL
jgi:hypothetical protein